MKRLTQIWNSMDFMTRLGIGIFGLYLFLYIWLDILEAILGVSF